MKVEFDQRWIAKYTSVPGNLPWWEKLEGEDRKNAEAWILQNKNMFVKGKTDAISSEFDARVVG